METDTESDIEEQQNYEHFINSVNYNDFQKWLKQIESKNDALCQSLLEILQRKIVKKLSILFCIQLYHYCLKI